jgi:hypothetical protein
MGYPDSAKYMPQADSKRQVDCSLIVTTPFEQSGNITK